jgi:hypothetical protein
MSDLATYAHELSGLTSAERQEILRRLKHGPVLGREALAKYANKSCREILQKREAGR